ncbi:MAG: sigma-70 family RNA polymerase sigma factor [Thermodesulfobacteriota bacterium]
MTSNVLGLIGKKEISDEQAMRKFQNGNAGSFDVLLNRHSAGVLRFIMKMTGNNKIQAEDLLQEIFIKVIERKNSYDPNQKFTTWLYSIARNHCIDHLRTESHRRHRSLDAPLSTEQQTGAVVLELMRSSERGQDDKLYDKEIGQLLDSGLDSLKEEFKEVFVLKEIQGLSLNEISDITQAPLGTVKSRLRYAYQNLRQIFTESGYFDEINKAKGASS